ncbi:phosphotransferase family protein [Actinomadura sp. GTD37]|uniref:phosphotransferase family protein n=1 Tax=Actinomadura sp. GTD37 TaxID=1778030 RepID=UPI0035C249EE
MDGRSSSHLLEMGTDRVIKRYRSWEHRQPEREWNALKLLDEHAPGTVPAPVSADLAAVPPHIVMSRLRGLPLAGPISPAQANAAAAVVVHVQEAIPQQALAGLPPRAGQPVELLQQVGAWCAQASSAESSTLTAQALAAGTNWIRRPRLTEQLGRPGKPVFGTGDGNLANYLWDGSEMRLVDFEYSGRSDRAYELAEMTEHISVRQNGATALISALEHVESAAPEPSRFKDCRRLLAMFWLLRILAATRGGSAGGSPVLDSQAERVLDLLS